MQKKERILKVVGINGSLRQASWNRKLLHLALSSLDNMGVETSEFDLNGVPMYSRDLEDMGMPESVIALRKSVEEADAVIVTTPEYNGTFSAAIKNCIEWLSRNPNLMDGKLFSIMTSSPGRLGAAKTHMPLSYALESEGALVMHLPKVQVPLVDRVVSPDGKLLDETTGALIDQTMQALLKMHKRYIS
jgi:chromate reductase